MVKLADGDRKKLIKLLKKLPELEDERSRQKFIEYVGLGELIAQINLAGNQFVAATEIVTYLSQYGRLPSNGREALGILIEDLKDFVGEEQQKFLDSLLVKYDMTSRVTPSSSFQLNLEALRGKRFDSQEWGESITSRLSARVRHRLFVLPQADVSTFTGREEELAKLKALLIDSQGEKQCSIVSVAGTGGIGKSALACHFATQYRDYFPDGVIGLRVDGKDPETLAREFAREMGVVLEDEEEQSLDAGTIMQAIFASRKMLLIFDNADEASIKKLRPGGNICAIIVTTRDRNLSFSLDISHEGTIDLPLLPKPESLLLLQRILGKERVNNELDAAYEIIRLVGNLPLALQISGANLKGKTRRLSDYAAYLQKKRADLKVRGNKDLNLQASLDISLESLEENELDFFACLSVCAEDGFSRKTAAIAGDCEDEWEAQDYLDCLYQLSLINEMETGENRFVFHPLIRESALKLAKSGSLYKEATQRHAEYFIDWIQLNKENLSVIASQIAEDIDDLILVGEWLRTNKIASYDFIESLHEFFEEYGYWKKAAELMKDFQEFAQYSEDWEFVVIFCTRRAKYLALQENFEDAKTVLQTIPDILTNIESEIVRKRSQVKFLVRLGRILEQQEDFDEAITQLQLAVSIARDLDEPESLRNALNVLGWVLKRQGKIDEAIKIFQQEITLNETLNDRQGKAIALNRMGGLLQEQGRYEEAISAFERQIQVSEAINDQQRKAIALNCMGGLLQEQGRYEEAISAFEREIEVSEAINDQKQKAIALNRMGRLLQQQGKYEEAISTFERSLEICEVINDQKSLAIALTYTGGLLQEQGKYEEAISAFQHQIEINTSLNDSNNNSEQLIASFNSLRALKQVLQEQKQLEKVEEVIKLHITIAQSIEDKKYLTLAFNWMGGLLQEQGRYEEAISAFERQIKVSEAINDQQGKAIALNCMGGLLQEQGRYEEAISAFERQIEVSEAINDQKQKAIALTCMGGLLQKQGRIDEAITTFKREIEINKILNNQQGIAIALNCIGKLLRKQEKFDEAISIFEQGKKISETLNDKKGIAMSLAIMREILQQQGKIDEALIIFEREFKIDEARNNYKRMVTVLNRMGRILKKQKKLDRAKQLFSQSYNIAVKSEDRHRQALILSNLGQILHQQGGKENLNFALIHFQESIKLGKELKISKHLAKVYTAMGEALFSYQEDEQAAIELIKGFEIEESSKNTRGLEISIKPLIHVLVKLKREKEAKQYFKRALAISPNNPNILELQKQLSSGTFLKQGKVIKIKHNQKEQMYGWIMPSDRSDNIYFYEPFINSDCISQLKKGTQVEVFIKQTPKGWCATYIRILDEAIALQTHCKAAIAKIPPID